MSTERVFRYVEIGKQYTCTEFNAGATYAKMRPIRFMPEWLKPIVLAAKMGGHIIVPVTRHRPHSVRRHYRPPDVVIWFTVDEENNLLSFMDLTYERLAYVR